MYVLLFRKAVRLCAIVMTPFQASGDIANKMPGPDDSSSMDTLLSHTCSSVLAYAFAVQ